MKKILFIALSFCLFVFSCKKEHSQPGTNPPVTGKKYAVKFNMNAFSVSNGAVSVAHPNSLFAPKTRALGDTGTLADAGITRYYYMVYDVNGKPIRRTYRDLNTPEFQIAFMDNNGKVIFTNYPGLNSTPTSDAYGTINDQLVTGTYTVIILGIRTTDTTDPASDPLFYIDGNEGDQPVNYNPLSTAFYNYEFGLTARPNTYDTFIYKGTVTVGSQNVQQSFILNRITAQLVIKAQDAVPANAQDLLITLSTEDVGRNLNTLGLNQPIDPGTFVPIIINSANAGLANTEYSCYITNTVAPMDITIKCVEGSGAVISTHTFKQVKFTSNQKTIFTGMLFGASTTNNVGNTGVADQVFSAGPTVLHF